MNHIAAVSSLCWAYNLKLCIYTLTDPHNKSINLLEQKNVYKTSNFPTIRECTCTCHSASFIHLCSNKCTECYPNSLSLVQCLQKENWEYFGTNKLLLMHTLLEFYNSNPPTHFRGYECYPKEELLHPLQHSSLYVLTAWL